MCFGVLTQVCFPDGAEDQQAGADDGRLRPGTGGGRGLPERVQRQRGPDHRHSGDAQPGRHTAEGTAVRAKPEHRFHHEEHCLATGTVPYKTGCCLTSCLMRVLIIIYMVCCKGVGLPHHLCFVRVSASSFCCLSLFFHMRTFTVSVGSFVTERRMSVQFRKVTVLTSSNERIPLESSFFINH